MGGFSRDPGLGNVISLGKSHFTLWDVLAEARAYLWFAGIAFVFGLMFLWVELNSADLVIWNGHCVPASFAGGIATYTAGGQEYFADNPPIQDQSPHVVTVCYYSDAPANGYIVHPAAYWVEGSAVLGPFGVAIILVLVGMIRGVRRLREPQPSLPPLSRFGA